MRQIAWGMLAAGLISTTAAAQEPSSRGSLNEQGRSAVRAMAPLAPTPAPAPVQAAAPKQVTVVAGADMPFLAGYVFRGIVQEFDPGFTFQPYVDVGVAVSETMTVNIGTWNSFHTGSNSEPVEEGGYNAGFYESDFYTSVTFVTGKWKPGLLFTIYGSPGDAFNTVYELAGVLSYDDSASSVPLSPKFVLAFELDDDGQADSGQFFDGGAGIYFEAGVRPTFKPSEDSPVTFAVPVKLGFSLKDYYEFIDPDTGEIDDNGFGFFQFGASASVGIPAIKAGAWEFHLGMDFYVFPKDRPGFTAQDGDDEPSSFKPVFNIGFSATF
jgi:hypothetical protein